MGALDSDFENWGGGGFLESLNRNPEDEKIGDAKTQEENPDFSIHSPEDSADPKNKEKTESDKEAEKKQREENKIYNRLVLSFGNSCSPEVLNKAAARYFQGVAPENTEDIKDPKQRAVLEAQNEQVEKVCEILGKIEGGSAEKDVLEKVFSEYVKDVKLARGIAAMEARLSPYGSALTAIERAEKDKVDIDLDLLRQQAMRESVSGNGERMYRLPVHGTQESVEMTREGMTKYSAMLKAKIEELNQNNKEEAELKSLDKKLAGRIESGTDA